MMFIAVLTFAGASGVAHAGRVSVNGVCVGDANLDGRVDVNELIGAVDNALAGCGLEPVTIRFAGRVGSEPFACGQLYQGLGTTGVQFVPSDFRFYVSGMRLIDHQGREVPLLLEQDGRWQVEDVALIDFEDKTEPCGLGTVDTNTSVRGMAPPGDYRGLRFVLGIPFHLNHGDTATAPAPLNLSAMFWNWRGGYKFMRVDEALGLFHVHLGSNGCVSRLPAVPPSHCSHPNRGEVILPEFDAAGDIIVADLAALLADNDLEENQEDTAPGCESGLDDRDCEPLFRNLGINFGNGLPDPSRQTFLRVEPAGS
jgi:uncharacterized repeat protein (TIGR04052 family)